MTDEPLAPAALERLAIEVFARMRQDGVLAKQGEQAVDLEIVPHQAREASGVMLTLRMVLFEGGQVRVVKEQEVQFLPDERIVAVLEGIALGAQRLADQGVSFDDLMPDDFVPARAALDRSCVTAEQIAARVGEVDPEIVDVIDDLSGTAPIARNLALERAIDDDPERVEPYLVYADWLTEHGDPRGELIACSAPGAPPAASRRAVQLLREHARYFLGPFMSSDRMERFVECGWRLGFIDRLRISVDYELSQSVDDFVARALRGMMSLVATRFLRSLTLGATDHQGHTDWSGLYPILVDAGPRPSMRKLFIGDVTREETELSWTDAGDLAALRGLYPDLTSLKIRAGALQLAGALAYPKLESLVIETGGLDGANVREVARTAFPALRELELWFGSTDYGASATLDDLGPILAGDRLPKLERLALRNCEFTDDLARAIASSQILPRLRILDLSMGTLTDAGAAVLSSGFGHLTTLDVSDNFLTRAPATPAVFGQQKLLDDDRRYVSVSE